MICIYLASRQLTPKRIKEFSKKDNLLESKEKNFTDYYYCFSCNSS